MVLSTEQHYQYLMEQLQGRQLALFIGADLPREVTGLPSRADLARELARRHGLNGSLPLAQVAELVSSAGNRWQYTAFIKDALSTAGKKLQPFHQGVIELVHHYHVRSIITTAYDDLLEWAVRQAGIDYTGVVDNNSLAFASSGQLALIKLYGDAQRPESLVITERDHSQLLRDHDKDDVIDEVRRTFKRNTILFYGYDLSDPDFKFLFDQVAESKFARLAYAVWPGLPEEDVRMWRNRGIVILEEDPLDVLSGAPAITPTNAIPRAEIDVPPNPVVATQRTQPEPVESEWNFEAIRNLLTAAFSDSELTTLCFDHFPVAYEAFGSGMGKPQRIQELLDYCRRNLEVERLLRLIEALNPNQYARFADTLSR